MLLIDILLQYFLNKIKKKVYKGQHRFLNSIPEKNHLNTSIVTFDATNLYNNISHELGKQAIAFWLDKYPDTLYPRFDKKLVIESLEIILNYNSFQFKNINCIQTTGKAMGTKMAPTHATLSLGYFEENQYEIIGKKYGNTIKEEFTKSWKRYLDNCFIFWKCQWGDITKLPNPIPNLSPQIKFTMEHSSKELPFLDILKKCKWPNHYRYLLQTHRHPIIPPLRRPPPKKL